MTPKAPFTVYDEYPCGNCEWVGCVVWMKYIYKLGRPPLTDEQKEKGAQMIDMFKDVLTQTGCKHQIPKERRLK